MKRSIVALALGALLAMPCMSHAEDYYWYKGNKILLERGNQQYILFDGNLLKESDKAQLIESGTVDYADAPNLMWGVTKPDAVLEDTEHIRYQISSFISNQGQGVNYFIGTHRFLVKLKDENDLSVLENMANQYKVEFDGKPLELPKWYLMRWGLDCQYNALELANIFYESGLFESAEPQMRVSIDWMANPQVSAEPLQKSDKTIRDGQLIIERGGKTFNAIGQIIQ